jgi:hypothetical protein
VFLFISHDLPNAEASKCTDIVVVNLNSDIILTKTLTFFSQSNPCILNQIDPFTRETAPENPKTQTLGSAQANQILSDERATGGQNRQLRIFLIN